MKGERIEVSLNTGNEPFACSEGVIVGPMSSQSSPASVDIEFPPSNSSLAVVDNRIYLRLDAILAPSEIAVFDSLSLNLLEIRDVSKIMGIKEISGVGDSFHNSDLETFDFDLSIENEVLVKVSNGYKMRLRSAIVNKQFDVSEHFYKLLNDSGSSFYHEDLSEFTRSILSHVSDIKTLSLSFELIQETTMQKLALPIAGAGNDLVFIRSVFCPELKARKAYNILQEVTIVSVTVPGRDEGDDFKELVTKQWKSFLRGIHSDTEKSGAHNLESAKQNWEELFHRRSSEEGDDNQSHLEESSEDSSTKNSSQSDEVSVDVAVKIGNSGGVNRISFANKAFDYKKLLGLVQEYYSAGTESFRAEIYDVVSNQIVGSVPLQSNEKSKVKELENASLLYNGYQLVLLNPDFLDACEPPEIVMNRVWSFSLSKALSEGVNLEYFTKKKFTRSFALPISLAYDCGYNTIWGYDPVSKNILKWRNVGSAPIGAANYSRSKGILFETPSVRLERLRKDLSQLNGKGIATLFLVLLEKLCEPYLGQINQSNSETFHQIKMSSRCYDNPSLGDQKCSLTVQNVPIFFEDEDKDDHTGVVKYFSKLSILMLDSRISHRDIGSIDSYPNESSDF